MDTIRPLIKSRNTRTNNMTWCRVGRPAVLACIAIVLLAASGFGRPASSTQAARSEELQQGRGRDDFNVKAIFDDAFRQGEKRAGANVRISEGVADSLQIWLLAVLSISHLNNPCPPF